MDSDLGAKVKKLRIAHGLTQEDVAKALEVTPGYISNVENGRNLMTLRMLSYYAESTDRPGKRRQSGRFSPHTGRDTYQKRTGIPLERT